MSEDYALTLALAMLTGCDVAEVIHDLDGTDAGTCAPDCSGSPSTTAGRRWRTSVAWR